MISLALKSTNAVVKWYITRSTDSKHQSRIKNTLSKKNNFYLGIIFIQFIFLEIVKINTIFQIRCLYELKLYKIKYLHKCKLFVICKKYKC